MDRIEKILVFVVVATIVVIVTIALSNSGDSNLDDYNGVVNADITRSNTPKAPSSGQKDLPVDDIRNTRGEAPAVQQPPPDPDPQPEQTQAMGPVPDSEAKSEPKPPKKEAVEPTWDSTYVVQKNESFWSIAVKIYQNGKHWKLIQDANKDVDPDSMQPGTVLILPRLKKSVQAKRSPVLEVPGNGNFRYVKLQKGEYLFSLLRQYKMEKRYKEIMTLNNLTEESARNLKAGHQLKIPKQ